MTQQASSIRSLINPGDQQFHRNLADTFEAIAGQGQEWFYQGEPARVLARQCLDNGGHLTLDDLAAYRVERRDPVRFGFRGSQCAINPFPSPGGSLIALTLGVLEELMPDPEDRSATWGSTDHLLALMYSMHASNLARSGHDPETVFGNDSGSDSLIGLDAMKRSRMLDDQTLRKWGDAMRHLNIVSRGTTHISVADEDGNLASLTVSNGEGCSYVLPGTGIMMNNMLGEEDINPEGFNRWRPAQRLASMMSPAVVVRDDGTAVALGTAGSNRIRSAMVQVLANLLAFDQSLIEAVSRPRIHLEDTRLSVEGGFGALSVDALRAAVPDTHVWPDTNLFFGGVNAVSLDVRGEFIGAADPRREGSVVTAHNNQ
jgi:gamma-glutamyltranspeptidase/glutathione hydrolase